MTSYDSVWGNADDKWTPIDFHDCHILNILLVCSWVALVAFSFFAIFTLITSSDVAALLLLASGAVWMTCGIAYIRIRRSRRKLLKVIQ
jgi:hypothetical protein